MQTVRPCRGSAWVGLNTVWLAGGRRADTMADAALRSELGNYWTAPPQTPKRKQRVEYDFGDNWSGDEQEEEYSSADEEYDWDGAKSCHVKRSVD